MPITSRVKAVWLAAALVFAVTAACAGECPSCGAKTPDEAKFCPQCGAKLPAAATAPAATEQKSVLQRLKDKVGLGKNGKAADEDAQDNPDPKVAKPKEEEEAPAAKPGTGALKLSSSPIACQVEFRGRTLNKTQPVLLIRDIPPGDYRVRFTGEGKAAEKDVTIVAGQTAFVFGSLRSGKPLDDEDPAPADTATATPVLPAATVPPVQPPSGESVPDADDAYNLAESLRKTVNPFRKKSNYQEARRLYEKILDRWPQSDKRESCLYMIGAINESAYVRDYRKAIRYYQTLLETNFHTEYEPRWHIAEIYENRLEEKASAREWYELAAKHCKSFSTRDRAAKKATELKQQGF